MSMLTLSKNVSAAAAAAAKRSSSCGTMSKTLTLRQQQMPIVQATSTFSTDVSKPYYNPKLVYRRPGEGGRGRMSDAKVKVALFGASGYLGGFLCNELGANGFMTYMGNRGCDMELRDRKLHYDLGRSKLVFYSPRDKDSMREVIADADVVVNLIGRNYESWSPSSQDSFPWVKYGVNSSFTETNITIPQTIAELCKEMQVDHLVHVSSASANPDSKSEFSRTKYLGEQAVKEAFPWATIIRPTQLFGKDDKLLNFFCKTAQGLRCVPLLWHHGEPAPLTQPVWVGDVAKAIFSVCDDPDLFEGRQVDCFGPHDYTYAELAKFVNDITDQNKPHLTIPVDTFRLMSKAIQFMQRDPYIQPDYVEVWNEDFLPSMAPADYEKQTDVATKILTLKDFGISPLAIEKDAFQYLQSYRFGGHFHRVKGYH